MSTPTLEACDIRVERNGFRLTLPRLEIAPRETLGIVGPNGAGKSTLLSALMGLVPEMRGTITRNGRPLPPRPSREWRQGISAVFQHPLLLDDTVLGNLLTTLRFKGVTGRSAKDEARLWLAYFGIPDLEMRHARALSGGEAQRVSLARAFLGSPQIIFLDEPFSALDPPTRASLVGDLADILRRTETSAVLVTHALDEMAVLCKRAAVMIQGELHQTGSPEDILFRPETRAIARFVGMDNVYPAHLKPTSDGCVASLDGSDMEVHLPAHFAGSAHLGFRPESARIVPPDAPVSPGSFSFTGSIARIAPGASGYRITVAGPVTALAECERFDFLRQGAVHGRPVRLVVPPEAWHVMTK